MFTEQLPYNKFTDSYYGNIQINTAEPFHFEELTTKCYKNTQESELNSGWGKEQIDIGEILDSWKRF